MAEEISQCFGRYKQMKKIQIELHWDDIIIETPDKRNYTVKSGTMTLTAPDLLDYASELKTQQQAKDIIIPEGFRLLNSEEKEKITLEKEVFIAYNETFGYITYIPDLYLWTNTFEPSLIKGNKLQSRPGYVPYVKQDLDKMADCLIATFPLPGNFTARVCSDEIYDKILAYFEKSGKLTHYQTSEDSSEWCPYLTNAGVVHSSGYTKLVKTGSVPNCTVCGINNFAGNTETMTLVINPYQFAEIRGGHYGEQGSYHPAAYHHKRNIRLDDGQWVNGYYHHTDYSTCRIIIKCNNI